MYEAAGYEAVRTTATTGALWAIVVLMSLLTLFLVLAPLVADSVQNREARTERRLARLGDAASAGAIEPGPGETGSVDTGSVDTGSVMTGSVMTGTAMTGTGGPLPVPAQRAGGMPDPHTQAEERPQGEIPTRADLPAQRSAEGDQAARRRRFD